MVAQAEMNLARKLPVFVELERNRGSVCIVGGGPSLADTLPELQKLKKRGAFVVSLNNTHDWLISRGIIPTFHVMLDARAENARFVQRPRPDVGYLIAAQCHPSVFDALKWHEPIVWVADVPGMRPLADRVSVPITLIGGGSTVGLKAMALMYLWGFRNFHLFGMDSCYRDGSHHAYPQDLNDSESRVETTVSGRTFVCAPWMLAQADDFQADAERLMESGCKLKAHGDGLIQTLLNQIKESHAA